jgi:K+-sensing histidine kinase KdpD
MSLNIIARKDYEELQKEILNLKKQENKKVACHLFPTLISMALKNLIDNGLKYSIDKKVIIKEKETSSRMG